MGCNVYKRSSTIFASIWQHRLQRSLWQTARSSDRVVANSFHTLSPTILCILCIYATFREVLVAGKQWSQWHILMKCPITATWSVIERITISVVCNPLFSEAYSRVLCNMGYPSETHPKLKSCGNSFVHNIRFNCPIVLKFCTEHDSITVVLCAKLQNDWITNEYAMGKRVFSRFVS